MAAQSVSDNHVSILLDRWKREHGPRVHQLRSSKIREIIQVQYADGTQGLLERDNFAKTWDIELSPDDKAPAKSDPVTISRAEYLECPNLQASLASRNNTTRNYQ